MDKFEMRLLQVDLHLKNAKLDFLMACDKEGIPYKDVMHIEDRIEFAIIGVQNMQKEMSDEMLRMPERKASK